MKEFYQVNAFREFARLGRVVDNGDNVLRKEAFAKLETYANSGKYTSYKRFREFLKVVYHSDKDAAVRMQMALSAYRKVKERISHDFYAAVGADAFTVIEFGDQKQLRVFLRELDLVDNEYTAGTILPAATISLITSIADGEDAFEVGDCKYELTLLHWLSENKMKWLIGNVDVERLAFLLKVLDGKAGTRSDRANALRVILSEGDLVSKAKEEDIAKFTFPPIRPEDEY